MFLIGEDGHDETYKDFIGKDELIMFGRDGRGMKPDEIRDNIKKIKKNETYNVNFKYSSSGLVYEAYFRYYR